MLRRARDLGTADAPRWTFALVSASGAVLTLDVTVVNVALSAIAEDLRVGLDRLPWMVSAYSLTFGSLLLTAGALADRIGHTKVFAGGTALFTAASACCALAPTGPALVVARAAQGIGGALSFAPALALLAAAYPGAAARRSAIAAFAAISSVAGALGPLVGGALVELAGWRWVFGVNVPIGLLILLRTLALPRTAPGARRRVDVLGGVLTVCTLLALHGAVTFGHSLGWMARPVLALIALAVLSGVALVASQRRPGAMLDVELLRVPAFATAALLGFLARMTGLGVLAFLTLWLSHTYGASALGAGLLLLPLTGSMLFVGAVLGRVQRMFDPSELVSAGFALQGLGLATLVLAGVTGGWPLACAGMVLLGSGGALIFPPLFDVVVAVVPADRAGVSTGLTNACSPLGTATGVAVFAAVYAEVAGPIAPDAAFATVCLCAGALCVAGVVLASRLHVPAAPGVHGTGVHAAGAPAVQCTDVLRSSHTR